MNERRLDMHVHTRWSFDCRSRLDDVITSVIDRGLNGIAVTDHDTIEGALILSAMRPPFEVIVGCEVTLDNESHVIGLYLQRPVTRGRSFHATAREIHAQGGLVMIPHPMRPETGVLHRDKEHATAILQATDVIEVFNAKSELHENRLAESLSSEYNIPAVAGSDAHRGVEVGRGIVAFGGAGRRTSRTLLERGARTIHGINQNEPSVNHRQSQEKRIKTLCLRAKPIVPSPIWSLGKSGWDRLRDWRDQKVDWPMAEVARFDAKQLQKSNK